MAFYYANEGNYAIEHDNIHELIRMRLQATKKVIKKIIKLNCIINSNLACLSYFLG